jgi:transcription elongation factor/antiterminator RfaH
MGDDPEATHPRSEKGANREKPMNRKEKSEQTDPSDQTSQKDSRLWFVVHTKPGNEERVKSNLTNQEIESFLPLVKVHQYCGGKMAQRIKPLFPNYLFARLDLETHYYKVKWTRGVNKILGSGGGPIPIAERVVQAIKEQAGEDNLIELENELKDGDAIQVTSGPLKDLMGIFRKEMSSKGRVKVLLSLIGVDVPVQISRYQIKKVA